MTSQPASQTLINMIRATFTDEKFARHIGGVMAVERFGLRVVEANFKIYIGQQLAHTIANCFKRRSEIDSTIEPGAKFLQHRKFATASALIGKQAGVANRDGGLAGQGLRQCHLAGAENALRRIGRTQQHADHLIQHQQRHTEDAADTLAAQGCATRGDALIVEYVVDRDWLLAIDDQRHHRTRLQRRTIAERDRTRVAVPAFIAGNRNQLSQIALWVQQYHRALFNRQRQQHVFGQAFQNMAQIQRRANRAAIFIQHK